MNGDGSHLRLTKASGAAIVLASLLARADLASSLQTLRAVGPEGRGNPAAARAWADVVTGQADQLPEILGAMDGAGDLARNWLFTAATTIADRTLLAGNKLPVAALGDFLLNTSHDARARLIAFELIARADPPLASKLQSGFLEDPANELRRDAVARLIDQAAATRAAADPAGAVLLYQQALSFARDVDQIDTISKPLKELGRPPDLPRLLGFLMHWKIIGPFDNTANAGFDTPFPPEKQLQFDAEHDGKRGKIRWIDYASTNDHGLIDLNQACGELKEVTGYATTEFLSPAPARVELRLACKNGWKVWCNGQFVFGRDEYHRATELDQYRLPVNLKAGTNIIFVKITQNELVEDWTREWQFQLRVTDATGRAILSADRPASRPADGGRTSRSTRGSTPPS